MEMQEIGMAEDKHEKALDLTEAALEAMDKGDDSKATKLIDEAKKLDPSAPKEVLEDMGG
jgi:Tfp pilus assembly protein PilF